MWIALAVLAVLLLSSMLSTAGGYKGVDTAKAFGALNDNQVKSWWAATSRTSSSRSRTA